MDKLNNKVIIKMKIDEIQEKIIEEMSLLNDWMDKYKYLIELGKSLRPMDEKFKTDENALPGCQSNVWIKAEINDNKIIFSADSDSLITKGLLALLLRVLNNRPPKEVVQAELYFIEEVGLSTNLSPSRANGLALVVKQLKSEAAQFISG